MGLPYRLQFLACCLQFQPLYLAVAHDAQGFDCFDPAKLPQQLSCSVLFCLFIQQDSPGSVGLP